MVDIKCHQWWIIYVSILQLGCNLLIRSQFWKGHYVGIDFCYTIVVFKQKFNRTTFGKQNIFHMESNTHSSHDIL